MLCANISNFVAFKSCSRYFLNNCYQTEKTKNKQMTLEAMSDCSFAATTCTANMTENDFFFLMNKWRHVYEYIYIFWHEQY